MHGVIEAAMWPTGSRAATANKKWVYADGGGVGGLGEGRRPSGPHTLMQAELIDGGVKELAEHDQPLLVRALRQRQGVGAAERVEEGGSCPT